MPQDILDGIPREIQNQLRRSFEPDEIEWLPKQVYRNEREGGGFRALALPYANRERVIQRMHESGLLWTANKPDIVVMTTEKVVLHGSWTVSLAQGLMTQWEFGEADSQSGTGGNTELFKAAATDLIRRLGRCFGIGSDLVTKKKIYKPCEVFNPTAKGDRGDPYKFKCWINDAVEFNEQPGESPTSAARPAPRPQRGPEPPGSTQLPNISSKRKRLEIPVDDLVSMARRLHADADPERIGWDRDEEVLTGMTKASCQALIQELNAMETRARRGA
ncbi:hypothetical protein FJY94_07390 [Candidatus Kaiserbacteria bacterium]|nr:hypothetical protein [Candidatus Kaiserbacteria bacterium]